MARMIGKDGEEEDRRLRRPRAVSSLGSLSSMAKSSLGLQGASLQAAISRFVEAHEAEAERAATQRAQWKRDAEAMNLQISAMEEVPLACSQAPHVPPLPLLLCRARPATAAAAAAAAASRVDVQPTGVSPRAEPRRAAYAADDRPAGARDQDGERVARE
eukprot:7177941-Prymnesium_polylepis.1